MADLYPGIRFPSPDFGQLGEIPGLMEEARGRTALTESLAGLKSSDPASLRAAANKAIATGTQKGIEAGIRLHAAAQAQENLEQKREADKLYLGALGSGKLGVPGAAPGGGQETIDIPLAPQAPAGPQAPPLFLQSGQVPGPQSALENAPPYQVAGPPTAPPEFPPPPPTQGAPQVTGVPPGLPIPAAPPRPVAPPPQVAPAQSGDPYEQARREAMQAGAELMKLGPRAVNTPVGRALMSQFTSSMSRLKLPEKEISYNQERLRRGLENQERVANGQAPLPDLTRRDFENDAATVKERYGATQKILEEHRGAYQGAKGLGDKLDEVRRLMENRRFAPGESGYADMVRNRIGAVTDIFRGMGVPDAVLPSRETLKSITEPVALREAFESTMKQAITAYISNRAFSDADRNALLASLPNLAMTKEGMQQAIDILDRAGERAKVEYQAAAKYASEKETRGTPTGIVEAVDRARDKPLVAPAPAAGVKITAEDEGRTGTDAQGNKWIVRGGRLVPLR